MKTIVIMQPGYLPWMGWFELLSRSNIFVVYDIVQYDKNGWRNRNRIKTANGPLWLTVPAQSGGSPALSEILIDNKTNWRQKHLQSILYNYQKSPYFKLYFAGIENILKQEWLKLNDINLAFINYFADCLGLSNKKIVVASKEPKPTVNNWLTQGKVERLVDICKYYKANVFYEPSGGKNYLEPESAEFAKKKIKLVFQNIIPVPYPQLYEDFAPGLSIVDLLFNLGPNSLKHLMQCGANVKF